MSLHVNTNQPTETAEALPTQVYYQPVHDEETQRRVAEAFARRGYELTADEDALEDLSILIEGAGEVLSINWGDLGSSLHHVGEYVSPEDYVTAAADWFESDLENDAPAEPGAAKEPEPVLVDVEAILAGAPVDGPTVHAMALEIQRLRGGESL